MHKFRRLISVSTLFVPSLFVDSPWYVPDVSLQMQEVWDYSYEKLGLDPSSCPALLTEPPLCSTAHREKMAEIFMEHYGVPELNISVTGLMAIYGCV